MNLNDRSKFELLTSSDYALCSWYAGDARVIECGSKMEVTKEHGLVHFWKITFFDSRTGEKYFSSFLYSPPPFAEFVEQLGKLYERQLAIHNEVD